MSIYSIRLSDDEEKRIERLADAHGMEKATLIRRLLWDAEERYGRPAESRFIDELLNVHGAGALLGFTIESNAERAEWPWVVYSVKCDVEPDESADDPRFGAESPSREVQARVEFELDERERLTIKLRDWESPATVWVATVPFRPSSTVTIKLIDLHPIMNVAE